MKKTLLTVSVAVAAATLSAQHKLTPPTTLRALEAVESVKLNPIVKPNVNTHTSCSYSEEDNAVQRVSVFINLEDGYSESDLESLDYLTIDDVLATCITATLPADRLIDLNDVPCIRRVEISRQISTDMNYARLSGNVTAVQEGFSFNGETQQYDGTGVIIGMMDTGLEGNHVNFKKNNGTGATRIQRLWWFQSNDGSYTEYTPENISSFTTDTDKESHATHVAGIMGGSFNGNGKYSYMSTPTGASPEMLSNQPIPYYGVATGADMALSVGDLYTKNILQGVKNIFDYAESVGKPAVVNLSLGHTYGPHDGTDAYSRELAAQGKRGIICMSAGNDGENNISIVKNITADSGTNSGLRTFVHGNSSNVINGIVDLWGTDDTVLGVQWGMYSISDNTFTPFFSINSAYQSVSTANITSFTSNFSGEITASSYIDPNNNRYEVYSELAGVSQKSDDKVIALNVYGAKNGQKLYLYSSTLNLTFSDRPSPNSGATISGYTCGSSANSINDGACADNIISVGAYVSRTTCGVLTSGSYYPAPAGFSVGAIAPFSSYGTRPDGITLPHVCAPGARIVSSYNRYYVTAQNAAGNMVGQYQSGRFNITLYYWGTMNGTSMSCPFVTGTIGLWLQADPTLDFDRVMDVINNTSTKVATNAARWGAGKIDALAGIKYVLDNRAAIGEVWADDSQRLIVTRTDGGYEVFVADSGELTATLYDLQGRPVAAARGTDGTVTIEAGHLQHGVYILEARTPSLRLTRKVTL